MLCLKFANYFFFSRICDLFHAACPILQEEIRESSGLCRLPIHFSLYLRLRTFEPQYVDIFGAQQRRVLYVACLVLPYADVADDFPLVYQDIADLQASRYFGIHVQQARENE